MYSGSKLLDFDFRASGFDLLLDLFGFGLRNAFLDRFRRAFNKSLGICQAQPWDRRADFLNDGDLVSTDFGQNDVERGFLLYGRCSRGATACGRCGSHGRGGTDTPLLFEFLNQVRDFQNGQSAQCIN